MVTNKKNNFFISCGFITKAFYQAFENTLATKPVSMTVVRAINVIQQSGNEF
jgi:hypothetical protein